MTIPKHLRAQIKALDLGIKALERLRRDFSPGHVAFKNGIDLDFAIRDHAKFEQYSAAIAQLEDLKEILLDSGAIRLQERLL